MKIVLSLISLLLSLTSFAQNEWVTTKKQTYSVNHPTNWKEMDSENPDELTMTGPTPDFEGKDKYLGTTLYITTEKAKYNSLDSITIAYKQKIQGTEFLKNVKIKKEKRIKFSGVDATEIIFTAQVANVFSVCRMILFQINGTSYEVSVTHDRKLKSNLKTEAYQVIDSFKLI